jgi:maleate isomerase
MYAGPQTMVGRLSGKQIFIPDANATPMPSLVAPGVIHNGQPVEGFGSIDPLRGYPDVRSFRRKFGLLIPATNTSTEHELWSILGHNAGRHGLKGVGIHTANVMTPRPQFGTADDLLEYQRQFLGGLTAAVDQVLLAQPQYLIMGMSLEHILHGLDTIRASMAEVEAHSGLSVATWHDAALAALTKLGARRLGLLTAFDQRGNENATRMFEDLVVHPGSDAVYWRPPIRGGAR